MPDSHCCAVGTRLDISLQQDTLMECCSLCSTGWGAVSRWELTSGHKSSYKHCYVSVQTSVSAAVTTAVLIWPPKCSYVQQFRSQEMGKEWMLYFCSLCAASWQDRLWFLHFSPCCMNIYQRTCPCFHILRVQMTQHKEYFRCGSMLSVPLGPSGWLPVG